MDVKYSRRWHPLWDEGTERPADGWIRLNMENNFATARLEAVQGDECHLNMPERIHEQPPIWRISGFNPVFKYKVAEPNTIIDNLDLSKLIARYKGIDFNLERYKLGFEMKGAFLPKKTKAAAEPKCQCTYGQKITGDGCYVCNPPKCNVCAKEVSGELICERCNEYYCEDCGATYNQFTQIDFNCCKTCGERNDE